MSYSTKMQLRMLLPCLMPLLLATLASWVLNTIDNLPGGLGGQAVESQMPEYIFLAGLAVTTLALAYQCFRLWRWSRGEGDTCYVCGCLLGSLSLAPVNRPKIGIQCLWGIVGVRCFGSNRAFKSLSLKGCLVCSSS